MAKLLVARDEQNEITTWGEEFAGGTEIPAAAIPSDWETFRTAKYLFDGTALVVRAGWVDPVIEPETPADPE